MRKHLIFAWPLLLALLFMLPRLASPQFGFLDDAATLKYGRELTRDIRSLLGAFTSISETGRFIPVYWLYYSGVYLLGWANPFIFYAANTLALLVVTGTIVFLVRFRGGSPLQASTAGCLFVLSGPVLESFYTNSQEGPPQTVLLGIAFLLLAAYSAARTRYQRLLIGVGLLLAFFGADCTMETSVAMAGVALAWTIRARFRLQSAGDGITAASLKVMTVTSAFAVICWYALRLSLLHIPLTGGTYTSGYKVEWARILDTGSGWVSLFFRDFPYLIPLSLPMLILVFRRKQYQTVLIIDSLVWMAAWMAIYVPWQSALEYYMLPFAMGCAIFGGVAAGQMWQALRRYGTRRLQWTAVIAAVLLFLTCLNNWTNGRYQITMDRSNMALIDYLGTLPRYSKVLINVRAPNEYEYEIGLHLAELKGRSDISVDYFQFQTPSPEQRATVYYVVTPVVANELHPSVRYGLYETGAKDWERVLVEFLGTKPELVYHVENQMRVADVGLHRLLCPLFGAGRGLYCGAPRPFIDGRLLTYGWKVYRIARRSEDVARPAVFLADGTWLLQTPTVGERRVRFGQAGDFPLRGDWDGRGEVGIGVFRPGNKTWYLDGDLDGTPDTVFRWDEMQAGDIPITGDWAGQGKAGPGYFRPRDASWHFINSFRQQWDELMFHFGTPDDLPVVGDWDGDGRDTIGIYRRATGEVVYLNTLAIKATPLSYKGEAGATPVVGPWSGSGMDSVAFVTHQRWKVRFVNCPEEPSNPPPEFSFGLEKGIPLAGRWR